MKFKATIIIVPRSFASIKYTVIIDDINGKNMYLIAHKEDNKIEMLGNMIEMTQKLRQKKITNSEIHNGLCNIINKKHNFICFDENGKFVASGFDPSKTSFEKVA